MESHKCSKYIWEDTSLFFQSYYVNPSNVYCKSDVTNHILYFFILYLILAIIISFFYDDDQKIIVFIFMISLSVIHGIYWYIRMNMKKEEEKKLETFVSTQEVPDGILEEVIGENVSYPTAKNPFMNVLVDEIKYNPSRAPAVSVLDPSVSMTLQDFFKTQFVNDPTDVFGRSQSQRQFYTTPSTTVPNDQASYQDWLYRIPGKTCKEGGREACLSGSDGSPVTWLNQNP